MSKKPEKKEEKAPASAEGGKDKAGLAALGVLVVFLGIIVWWALPKDGDPRPTPFVEMASASAGSGSSVEASVAVHAPPTVGRLPRLPGASCELAILTDKPEEKVKEATTADAIGKRLDVRWCGPACDAVKKALADKEQVEIEVGKTDDYILPPADSFPTVAATLTAAERATIAKRTVTVTVRTKGPATIDQLPARACFAAAAIAADQLFGLVYDETLRRIVTAREMTAMAITVPLGEPVFSPKHVVVQVYRQDDGTARVVTLGMIRFGSPDFVLRGSAIELGPWLASFANVAAADAAAAKSDAPIAVSGLSKAPRAGHGTAHLYPTEAARAEGDPENDLVELAPSPAAEDDDLRAAWRTSVEAVFGEAPKTVFAGFDDELQKIAASARKDLPGAVKRFEAGDGALYLKGPFPIPDAGATEEWMWIQVTSCDAKGCAGVLSNTPGWATNLAAGSPVRVERARVADWLLRLPDGGTAGGASIDVLSKKN